MTRDDHIPNLFALEAEAAVIGACLMRPETLRWVEVVPGCFTDPRYRHIWRVMGDLEAEELPIDELTVAARLDREGYLDAVGGPPALSKCALAVVSASNVDGYVRILHERRVARELLLLAGDIRSRLEGGEESDEILGAIERQLGEVDTGKVEHAEPLGEVVHDVFRGLFEAADPINVPGIPTGLATLDELTTGVPIGVPTIVAGRPGRGKSTLALEMADAASERGYGAMVANYENPRRGWGERWLAKYSGIDVSDIRARMVPRGDVQEAAARAAKELRARTNLVVQDTHGWPIPRVIRQFRARRRALGLRMLIVDYIQRCPPPYPGQWEKHATIEANVQLLGDFAGTDDVAVVVCSQIGRSVVERDGTDRRPTLGDLSGSKALEETGKLILALHQAPATPPTHGGRRGELPFGYGDAPTDGGEGTPLDIIILKNHQGVGEAIINARFDKPHCRITTGEQ